jgi:hypothetical protein
MKKLSEIITAVTDYPVKRVAVAAAADLTVLEAVKKPALPPLFWSVTRRLFVHMLSKRT